VAGSVESFNADTLVFITEQTRLPEYDSIDMWCRFLETAHDLGGDAERPRLSFVQFLDSPRRREAAGGHQKESNHRAAASALSSGRVLKAMGAAGAALWTALTTASKSARRRGGRRTPAPITTQS
jgi:hypothetical protein